MGVLWAHTGAIGCIGLNIKLLRMHVSMFIHGVCCMYNSVCMYFPLGAQLHNWAGHTHSGIHPCDCGLIVLTAGQTESAQSILQKCIDHDPNSVEAHLLMAQIALHQVPQSDQRSSVGSLSSWTTVTTSPSLPPSLPLSTTSISAPPPSSWLSAGTLMYRATQSIT